MPEPTPPLDLDAIVEAQHHGSGGEACCRCGHWLPCPTLQLVARVRALETENAALRAMLPAPPPPVNRPEQAHTYWRTHRTGPNRGDKPCRRCSTLMRDVPGNKQYCSPACQQADARDGYGRGPYSWS